GISVHTRTAAESIDQKGKVVRAIHRETGEIRDFSYDQLVLATGARPILPDIDGLSLSGVHTLGSIEEALGIRKEIDIGRRKVVIVGGGLIGMEVAESLTERGADVTVVEVKSHILPQLLDREMAHLVEKHLAQNKVTVRTSTTVLALSGDEEGRVAAVKTSRGDIPAELVLLAVGVRPNVTLARDAGLATGPLGGILVDETLRTSDPDIFAGGDCVENRHMVTGAPIFAPMGSTANKHGRVIGDNLTGGSTRYPGVLGTVILKIFDFHVGATGLNEQAARAAGIDPVTAVTPGPDRAHYYPGAKTLFLKGVVDRDSGRWIGVQAAGPGEAAKRLDMAALAIAHGIPLEGIALADTCYAPPYANALDNLVHLATTLENKMKGLSDAYTPQEVKEKIDREEEFVMIDVRTPPEYRESRIDDPRNRLIPLGKLREQMATLPKNSEIVTYCKTSLRGYEALRTLRGAGFRNVRFMDG
ncbi:MAG: FAD-dependent oxidoreductase, partial [Deltaproteobacteria bacterium]|nr:FAD-dependent oxidoreductase [Deltaproteobacteria bacterium]